MLILWHAANQGRRRQIYVYRDNHRREVDFLIPSPGRFGLIECERVECSRSSLRGFEEVDSSIASKSPPPSIRSISS